MTTNKDFQSLYNRAIRLLAYRARTVREIKDKLQAKSASSDLVDQVVAKLISQELLNDQKFIANFIRYQLSIKPQGERSLIFRLRHKGLDTTLIQPALKAVFSSPQVALELATKALASKNWSRLPLRQQAQKTARFLNSRGFSYPTIRPLIDALLKSE